MSPNQASGTVLVTGACGFLGRHIAAEMHNRGRHVIGVDMRPGHKKGVDPAGRSEWHNVELPSPALDVLLKCSLPYAVIHSAGSASVPASVKDPVADFAASANLCCRLLDSVRRNSPESKVLFLSSAAVYGNPARLPVDETAAASPISPYGFHKRICETLAEEFHTVYGLRTCCVRIFSAYGAGLEKQVLWDISQKALAGQTLSLLGTGDETRDFVHARDVACGVSLVVERAQFRAEVYNLATGVETRIRDLAQMLINALGRDAAIEFTGKMRAGDPARWRADISRISSLGFTPEVALTDGVKEYARWILDGRKTSRRR